MIKNVVAIGGGTGSHIVLKSLKDQNISLSAIVSMADSGGSTGKLREELNVLPPGDVRQCLLALSDTSVLWRDLINYRFEEGSMKGHNFGNLLLSALEKVTGNFEVAVEEMQRLLQVKGCVIPVTTSSVQLKMMLQDNSILHGEKQVYLSEKIDQGYQEIFLEPGAIANPNALEAIDKADVIILGPGGLYTSLIPNLLIKEITEGLKKSKAKKIFIVNLINKKGQTTSFTVQDHIDEIVRFIGEDVFDYVLVNNEIPLNSATYEKEGTFIKNDLVDNRVIACDLLGDLPEISGVDIMQRSIARHDAKKLEKQLVRLVNNI